MKNRLLILSSITMVLFLAACSLAEDIAPPAEYVSPTNAPSESTAIPTVTSQPVTKTLSPTQAESTPTGSPNETPASLSTTEAVITPTPPLLLVSGTVSGDGVDLPADTSVTLHIFDASIGQVIEERTSSSNGSDAYSFADVPGSSTYYYFTSVNFAGVTYDSAPTQYDGQTTQLNMPVKVYNSSKDSTQLTITQVHLQADFSVVGQVQFMVLYVITNKSSLAVIIPTDGTIIPIIQNPENAQNVKYQLAQSSSPLINADDGFAMLPGSEFQYGIIVTYSLPYDKKTTLTQPFVLPVSSATVIVPEGVKVRSNQLKDSGQQTFSNNAYHLFKGESMAAGSSITAVISGMPGDKGLFPLSQRNLLMLGVGIIGLILVALGVFLFIRERRLVRLEELEEDDTLMEESDSLGKDKLSIMDAIIALDDQFKAGGITREAYTQRRDELKERLKNLVD